MGKQQINRIEAFFLKEQFRPSILGIIINPFYYSRRALYKNIKRYSNHITGRALDIGCGSKPYEDLFSTEEYIGMDIKISGHDHTHSKIDVFYDGVKFLFDDNSIDSIVCFEVLQVINNPDMVLKETYRVLRPGGKAIFTVPFIWDEHEQPYDYARYTSFGLRFLFEKAGFIILDSRKLIKDLRLLALLTNAYIYKVFKRIIPSRLSLLFILPITALINILSCIFFLFPGNPDLYFGNIFLLQKPD